MQATQQMKRYVQIVKRVLHPSDPDPVRSVPVSVAEGPNNDISSESDVDGDAKMSDLRRQEPEEHDIEYPVPFTNPKGTYSDRAFVGLAIPELIDILRERGAEHLTEQGHQRDFDRFMELYHLTQTKLKNYEHDNVVYPTHPLFALFNYSDNQIKLSYFILRKEMIAKLCANYDKLVQKESHYPNRKAYLKAKKVFDAFEGELFEHIMDRVSTDRNLKAIKWIWIIQISYLSTECIVESVCSVMKIIYRDNRRKMNGSTLKKHVMNVTMLPDKDADRTQIVNWVAIECLKRYGDGIIHDKHYLRKRRKIMDIVKSIVLDRKYKGDDSVFMGMRYILSAAFNDDN
eukprot:930192_1